MDPQQRLLLETAWEAIEDAGFDPAGLGGSRSGVYVGAASQGYGFEVDTGGIGVEGYGISGVSTSLLSGRIAYTLGLEGAAVTVDTACSSSLVALHLAIHALRRGEVDLALAGGATVMATPSTFVEFSRQGGLSRDGRCRSFSEDADGTGWSEGAGFLLVERLSDARRLGHDVLAVVRGSAVNQDGASNGLTAPNGSAQQLVILAALADGGIGPGDVDLVEAHGTGTKLGDPIEAEAVLATYGQGRDPARPVRLGSLKSNIGHTQSAAGVAAIIKVVEAIRHRKMPRTLHADKPSLDVDWSAAVELLTSAQDWPGGDRPRRAGVSAFGIGGTNAHVIIEEAAAAEAAVSAPDILPVPLVLSGKTPDAVRDQAAALRAHVIAHPEQSLSAVARSLGTTRTRFDQCAAVVAESREQLADALTAVEPVPAGRGRVGMLFSGQGAQRPGMGRDLAARFPVFAAALNEVCAVTDPLLGCSLRQIMWDESAEVLGRTEYAQAALFAYETALARLWQSWGVTFAAVAGHSVGELAAAVTAGVLTMPDAARIAVTRGRLMQALPAGGAMLAAEATEDEASVLLEGEPEAAVAAVNGPRAVVVSGSEAAVHRLEDHWRSQGRRTTRLHVSHAFHSQLMEPALDAFAAALSGLSVRPATLQVHPSADTDRPFGTPEYWTDHARRAVRFADALTAMTDIDVLIEIGPDAALTSMAGPDRIVLASARRQHDEVSTLLAALARANAHGVQIDWTAVLGEGDVVRLPTYAFQHTSYWLTSPERATSRPSGRDEDFWAAIERQDTAELTEVYGAPAPLLPALPSFALWHREVRERQAADAWRYRVAWRPASPQPAAAQVAGTWLVVQSTGDTTASATRLRALTRILADVVNVQVAGDRQQVAEALSAVVDGLPVLSGVISLVDRPEDVLIGIQALGDARIGARLWCLTQGAAGVDPGEAPSDPGAAAIWGLGRVAGLEHPDRWGGLVDLPFTLDERTIGFLAGILAGDGTEDQVAIRASGVWLRRLEPAPAGHATQPRVPSGTVLITGGTGSLGAWVARWLAAGGVKSLVLLSRRGEQAPGADDLLADLRHAGARVRLVAADVADAEQMSAVVAGLAEDGEPVRAVFHTAGIGQNRPLDETTPDEFYDVYAGKTEGARILDELFADIDLDQFVLFSSIAGVWGSGRQPAYAAANAYLDALAQHRAARGLRATAVAWGVWAGSGMVDEDGERELRRRGLVPMPPAQGIRHLERAMERDQSTVVVADIDWEAFLVGYTAARPRPWSPTFRRFVHRTPPPPRLRRLLRPGARWPSWPVRNALRPSMISYAARSPEPSAGRTCPGSPTTSNSVSWGSTRCLPSRFATGSGRPPA